MVAHINMVKVLTNQLRSIEVKIEDEDMYMVLLMNFPPSFDNLVKNLESMSIMLHFLTKFIMLSL